MRLVRDYYGGAVACNDIGEMAYGSRQYVLDLAGLASIDALRARISNPGGNWIEGVVAEHKVGMAVIYDSWFPVRPSEWVKVATFTLDIPRVSVGESQVSVYATSSAGVKSVKEAVIRFTPTLPLGVVASLLPGRDRLAAIQRR
jgi:hypothetical protein